MMKYCVCLLVFATLLGASTNAHSALQCEYGLVNRGLTPIEVAERCGPADAQVQYVDFLLPNLPIYVDEWVYELGTHKFRRLLRFENGRLRDIEQRPKPRRRLR